MSACDSMKIITGNSRGKDLDLWSYTMGAVGCDNTLQCSWELKKTTQFWFNTRLHNDAFEMAMAQDLTRIYMAF